MRLSIVVPAHNEEKRIGPMLEAYLPFFAAHYQNDVEILVVVNGSTDRTDQIVASYAERYPCLKIMVEPDRIGKGGALMMGFRKARGELIGFVDADGSTPPQAFQDLVDNIGAAGGIIASRWSPGAVISPRQPLDRRIASRMFNFLTRILFGLSLRDTQCGAKLMTREAVATILPCLGITQWAFDVDLLFQLRRSGHKIREIPTTWHDVAGSKIQVGRASAEMILALVRLRLMYSPFKWVVGIYDRFVAPWLHPVGAERDHLLTHSLMLFTGGQVANVCNMVFQVVMAGMLKPEQYGVMSAMLSLLAMVGAPFGALSGTVTHFTSHAMLKGDCRRIKGIMGALCRDLMWPIMILLVVTVIWHQRLALALKLDSSWPLYMAAGTLVLMLLSSIPGGVLVGMQAFEWSALSSVSWSLTRLVSGIVLVMMGFSAMGALTAHLAGFLAVGLFGLLISLSLLGKAGKDIPVSGDGHAGLRRPDGVYSYMSGYAAAFAAYGVLANADVLMVKYYFSPEQAGVFAKAAMVARIVVFLPGPIAAAMFPKVTSGGESSQANRRILNKAVVISSVIAGGVSLICVVMPGLMLRLLGGGIQPGQEAILRGMALALAPLTVVMLLLNYELAQRRFGIMIPLFICAVGYLGGVGFWHETLLQVVMVLGVVSVAALVGCWAYLWGSRDKERTNKAL